MACNEVEESLKITPLISSTDVHAEWAHYLLMSLD